MYVCMYACMFMCVRACVCTHVFVCAFQLFLDLLFIHYGVLYTLPRRLETPHPSVTSSGAMVWTRTINVPMDPTMELDSRSIVCYSTFLSH